MEKNEKKSLFFQVTLKSTFPFKRL